MYGLERHLGAATKKLRAPGGAAPGCSATTQPCGLGTGGGCPGCWRGGAQGDSQRVSACTAPPTHTHTCAHPHTPPPHPHTRAHPQSLTHTKCHPVSSPALAVTAAHGWRLLAVLGRWVGWGGSQAPGHRTLTRAWKGEVTGQPGTVPCLGVLPATALGKGPPTPTTARHPGPGP